jgi:dTDP-glucose pyrophosphorylase
MTVKQLNNRINKTSAALARERRKNIEITARADWGSGMRKVCPGPSDRRENELTERLENYIKQLKEMEKTP